MSIPHVLETEPLDHTQGFDSSAVSQSNQPSVRPISAAHFGHPESMAEAAALYRLYETPYRSYEDYRAAGSQALAMAINQEEMYGLGVARFEYEAAAGQFKGAMGSEDEVDPLLLLQYGTCLAKLSQVELEPYQDPLSKHVDRRKNLAAIAEASIKNAWETIKTVPEPQKEDFVPAAVVAANGLETVFDIKGSRHDLAQTALLDLVTDSHDLLMSA